jgi:hypothetical protein
MENVIWWLVFARGALGLVFMVIAMQMVFWSRDELLIRKLRSENGMQSEILKGQVRFGWSRVGRLFLLGASATLALPFVIRPGATYRWPQVVASALVLLLTFIDVIDVVMKWRERDRLLSMAENYRRKTKAEGGKPDEVHG